MAPGPCGTPDVSEVDSVLDVSEVDSVLDSMEPLCLCGTTNMSQENFFFGSTEPWLMWHTKYVRNRLLVGGTGAT